MKWASRTSALGYIEIWDGTAWVSTLWLARELLKQYQEQVRADERSGW